MKTRQILLIFFISGMICQAHAQNNRNVLIEFQTGTLCGYCPCADSVVEKVILKNYPNTVVLAYHNLFNDPYQFFTGNAIRDSLTFHSEPEGSIDRVAGNLDYTKWADTVRSRYLLSPSSPVLMNIKYKTYNPATRALAIMVDFTPLVYLSGEYRVNFVLTENNLIYKQSGNSNCPGGDNYVHHWVTRVMMNGPAGDSLHYGFWEMAGSINKTFHYTIDSAQWIPDNCDIVMFVYKLTQPFSLSEIQQAEVQGLTRDLSISETRESETAVISVYPNPVHGICNIHISVSGEAMTNCTLFDISGKEILQLCNQKLKPGLYNVEFDASALSPGTYSFIMVSGSRKVEKKIIVSD